MRLTVPSVDIPSQYVRARHAIQEIEAAMLIASIVQGCRRILNIGPSWGRDYYALAKADHQVINLDVAFQEHLPNLVIGNIAETVAFADQTFDAVLMAEVLEHIWNDFKALSEARRVLKDSGKLVVTVPFYHDKPEYHVRIHSPATIRRLLQANGFVIIDYIERGGLVTFPRVVHAVRKIFALLGQGDNLAHWVVQTDRWLGKRRGWLRLSPAYGCYIAALKGSTVNAELLNRVEFVHEQHG
jgi:SAM-dependent methyltransferase